VTGSAVRRAALAACLLGGAAALALGERSLLSTRDAAGADAVRAAAALVGRSVPGTGHDSVATALGGIVESSRARSHAAQARAHAAAEAALARAVRGHDSAARRSAAANLLGVLLYGEGQSGQSLAAFRQAIRLDPHDDAAKLNLELAMPHAPRSSQQSRGGASRAPGPATPSESSQQELGY